MIESFHFTPKNYLTFRNKNSCLYRNFISSFYLTCQLSIMQKRNGNLGFSLSPSLFKYQQKDFFKRWLHSIYYTEQSVKYIDTCKITPATSFMRFKSLSCEILLQGLVYGIMSIQHHKEFGQLPVCSSNPGLESQKRMATQLTDEIIIINIKNMLKLFK